MSSIMSCRQFLLLPCLLATPLFIARPALATITNKCDEARQNALENILDDEGILADLDDDSRGAIITWASTSLDDYATRCASGITMRAYGLRVKEGIRLIEEMTDSGTTHHATWLYRARLITWRQLAKLKKLNLSATDANLNTRVIMEILTVTDDPTTQDAPRNCRPS